MDTIFALSTPPGKSGIAVVRVSGLHAASSLRALGVRTLPQARKATLATLCVPSQDEKIDQAIVLYFPAPGSFTGEDIVEYHIHGGRASCKALLAALGAFPGLRPALPGEFTRRAFLNGKMDLTAAEGLADLIDAETEAQRKQALRFMRGDAEIFYQSLRQGVLETLALTEAYIDFPDEEIPAHVLKEAYNNAAALAGRMESELASKSTAERVRDGIQITILGPPNAGKSSLMNLLAQRDVAIVSQHAGTTRDVIEVHMDIGGYAATVADTAGLREAGDDIEREGVRRSLERAQESDVHILVLDAAKIADYPPAVINALLPQATAKPDNTILLLNKTDLSPPSPLPLIEGLTPILFSAKTHAGLEALMAALCDHAARLSSAGSVFIARERHRHHLQRAAAHLRAYMRMENSGLELQCEELRSAAAEIGRITGAIDAEEVLGQIFSRFCIGK